MAHSERTPNKYSQKKPQKTKKTQFTNTCVHQKALLQDLRAYF